MRDTTRKSHQRWEAPKQEIINATETIIPQKKYLTHNWRGFMRMKLSIFPHWRFRQSRDFWIVLRLMRFLLISLCVWCLFLFNFKINETFNQSINQNVSMKSGVNDSIIITNPEEQGVLYPVNIVLEKNGQKWVIEECFESADNMLSRTDMMKHQTFEWVVVVHIDVAAWNERNWFFKLFSVSIFVVLGQILPNMIQIVHVSSIMTACSWWWCLDNNRNRAISVGLRKYWKHNSQKSRGMTAWFLLFWVPFWDSHNGPKHSSAINGEYVVWILITRHRQDMNDASGPKQHFTGMSLLVLQ